MYNFFNPVLLLDIKSILIENKDIFDVRGAWIGPATDIGRKIIWWFLTGIVSICEELDKILENVLHINTFFNNAVLNRFITNQSYKRIFIAIMCIAIAVCLLKTLLSPSEKSKAIFRNALIALLVFFGLPELMDSMQSMTMMAISIRDEVISEGGTNFSPKGTLDSKLFDVQYYVGAIEANNSQNINNIDTSKIFNIDYSATIDSDNDIFKKKLTTNDTGDFDIEDLEKNLVMSDEVYYRYKVKGMFSLCIEMIALGCAIGFTILKVGRIIWELGFNKIYTIFTAFSDMEDGQRTKACIKAIVSSFIILIIACYTLRLYFVFNTFVEAQNFNTAETLTKTILKIIGALAVIDGANIVEQTLGMDAGVKDGQKMLMSSYAGASLAGKGVGAIMSAGKGIDNIFRGSKNVDGSRSGGVMGMLKRNDGFNAMNKALDDTKENTMNNVMNPKTAFMSKGQRADYNADKKDQEQDYDKDNPENRYKGGYDGKLAKGLNNAVGYEAIKSGQGEKASKENPLNEINLNDKDKKKQGLDYDKNNSKNRNRSVYGGKISNGLNNDIGSQTINNGQGLKGNNLKENSLYETGQGEKYLNKNDIGNNNPSKTHNKIKSDVQETKMAHTHGYRPNTHKAQNKLRKNDGVMGNTKTLFELNSQKNKKK